MTSSIYHIHFDCEEDCKWLGDLLQAYFQSNKKFDDYYFHLEYSSQKKKHPWHLQGWFYSSYREDYVVSQRFPLRKRWKDIRGEKLNSEYTYSISPVRESPEQLISYIAKNTSKTDYGLCWKSYSDESFNLLLEPLSIYVSKEEWKNSIVTVDKPKRKSTDDLVDEILATCVSTNLCMEKELNYRQCYNLIKKYLPKSLDSFIWERNMYGITYRVERKLQSKRSTRVEDHFDEVFFSKSINYEIFH